MCILWVIQCMMPVQQFSEIASQRSTILQDLGLKSKSYLLATVHRPYNTDNPENLRNILNAFIQIKEPIVFPVHPRTRNKLEELKLESAKSHNSDLKLIDPIGYLDILCLEKNAKTILTDSGGMQKEAYFFRMPCITLRPETEWLETIETGWNRLTGTDTTMILESVRSFCAPDEHPPIFGDANAAIRIMESIEENARG